METTTQKMLQMFLARSSISCIPAVRTVGEILRELDEPFSVADIRSIHRGSGPALYLITPTSKKQLRYRKGLWSLPVGPERFRSLRAARVYIKNNYGRLNAEVTVQLAGEVRGVEVSGTFTR